MELSHSFPLFGTLFLDRYYQEKALGTAHAIMCAEKSITGKTVVAFADTLFKADFVMDTEKEGVIWVQKIKDPSQFGVVKINELGVITDFIEKPSLFKVAGYKDTDNMW